ncbi:phosphoribosyltransferase domain-containing protein, partial [Mycobacterium kansasii]
KRSFLFVSKVLGKHIPIRPAKGILGGSLLAARYMQVVKESTPIDLEPILSQFLKEEPSVTYESFINEKSNPVIIGFAETATALGHAF